MGGIKNGFSINKSLLKVQNEFISLQQRQTLLVFKYQYEKELVSLKEGFSCQTVKWFKAHLARALTQ